jgi:hypothetical protein
MLSVCLYIPAINFWVAEPVFMKLSVVMMVPEPVYMCIPLSLVGSSSVKILLSLLGNGSVKTLQRQQIRNNKIVGRVVFYANSVVARKVGD